MASEVSTSTTKQPDPLEQQAVALTGISLPAKIASPEQFEDIAGRLKDLTAWLKAWNEHHDPVIESAHRTHDLACKAKSKYGKPALELKRQMAQLLGEYKSEQDRIAEQEARAEQDRLDKIDRENRAAEALELAKRANTGVVQGQRLEADAQAARELAEQAPDDATRFELVSEADHLERVAGDRHMEAAYDRQASDHVAAAPAVPSFVPTRATTPKVSGVATNKKWEAQVVDKKKFLQHVLDNWERYENYVEILMPKLNSTATNVGKEIEIEPGVYARPKYGASARV